jgi:holo-[acyl-carrier protein] synthase
VAIVGHGIDIVDVARFGEKLERTPALSDRLLTPTEQEMPLESMAARFAAKEALIKALGGSSDFRFVDVEIPRGDGRPEFVLTGDIATALEHAGIALHLSISHDGGMAVASVIAERR